MTQVSHKCVTNVFLYLCAHVYMNMRVNVPYISLCTRIRVKLSQMSFSCSIHLAVCRCIYTYRSYVYNVSLCRSFVPLGYTLSLCRSFVPLVYTVSLYRSFIPLVYTVRLYRSFIPLVYTVSLYR